MTAALPLRLAAGDMGGVARGEPGTPAPRRRSAAASLTKGVGLCQRSASRAFVRARLRAPTRLLLGLLSASLCVLRRDAIGRDLAPQGVDLAPGAVQVRAQLFHIPLAATRRAVRTAGGPMHSDNGGERPLWKGKCDAFTTRAYRAALSAVSFSSCV